MPPELRAFYKDPNRPPPASAFSRIVNWCHDNDLMHLAHDVQEQVQSFTGILHVQASGDPEWLGMSGVASMLDALCKHDIRCKGLNVQLCNTDHAIRLCSYLDRLGRDGLHQLWIDLSAYAADQFVPKELGHCILSMPTLHDWSLRGPDSGDDASRVRLQDNFFSTACDNRSIERLQIDGSIDGQLPDDLVRQWLFNKALSCIVLGTSHFAVTFCQAIARLAGQHAVNELQLVRWFHGIDNLALQFILAQTGVLHLTLPACTGDADVRSWHYEVAIAVSQNYELQSLATMQADGTPREFDPTSDPIANSLSRNQRICTAVRAGDDPHAAFEREVAPSIAQALQRCMRLAYRHNRMTLNELASFMSTEWGPVLDERVLTIALAQLRIQLAAAFDNALPDPVQPSKAQQRRLPGRRALPPVDHTPPFPTFDDPWAALMPRFQAILDLPDIPEPVERFLSARAEPWAGDFRKVVLWCLNAMQQEPNLLDLVVSMQYVFPDFVGELNLAEGWPADLGGDPISALERLGNAGVHVAAFLVAVNSPSDMDRLVRFLDSPGMLSTFVQIDIRQHTPLPSALGRALFGNPRLKDVRLLLPSTAALVPQTTLPSDFFDALTHNATLRSLTVQGSTGPLSMNCDFHTWISKGVVEDISVPAGVLGNEVTNALGLSAGFSRVRSFRVGEKGLAEANIARLFSPRLGLQQLTLPVRMLQGIAGNEDMRSWIYLALADNRSLVTINVIQDNGDLTNFDDQPLHPDNLPYVRQVLTRNRDLQSSSIRTGLASVFKDFAAPNPHSLAQALTGAMQRLIEDGQLNAGLLTQLTAASASTTRQAFMAKLAEDRTGSKFFGDYFKTSFNPDAGIYSSFRQVILAGGKLSNPPDHEALKEAVVGAMMAWVEATLRPGRPEDEQEHVDDVAPMAIDPTNTTVEPEATPMEVDERTGTKRPREDGDGNLSSTKAPRT